MLRGLLFGRTKSRERKVPAESQARRLIDEESEDSRGIGRRRTRSNAQCSAASIFAGRNTATAWHSNRPGTRCRNPTRRSISIFKVGVEQASPSTPKESHSMANITAKLLAATVSCALLSVFPAAAQQQGPSRIRGTIESVDGNDLTITARDGTTQKIGLASDVVVTGLVKTTLADVKPGSYIGVTGMPLADGSQKAIAIHIFPESARGTADGFRQYDLRPNSTMTNATVAQEVDANDGKSLSVKYKGGEKKVVVSPDTPIVNFVDGATSELKAGAKIIAFVAKQNDGTLSSKRVLVGRDGITPPM
jgi:uncharacterized protein Veg